MAYIGDFFSIIIVMALIAWIFISLWRNRKKEKPREGKKKYRGYIDTTTIAQTP